MKCHILFSRKNKKNIISLLSAVSAHIVISVNTNKTAVLKITSDIYYNRSQKKIMF